MILASSKVPAKANHFFLWATWTVQCKNKTSAFNVIPWSFSKLFTYNSFTATNVVINTVLQCSCLIDLPKTFTLKGTLLFQSQETFLIHLAKREPIFILRQPLLKLIILHVIVTAQNEGNLKILTVSKDFLSQRKRWNWLMLFGSDGDHCAAKQSRRKRS